MPAGNPSKQPPSSAHFVESVTDLHQIESQGMTHSSTPHHSQGGRFPPSHVRMSNNPSTLDPMHANPLPFLSPQPYVGYSADPQPLLDPRTVPLNSYNNPNSSSTQVAPWFATPQSHSDASGSSLSPSVNYFPEDTHGSASPASDGAPSNTSFDSSRQDVNGPADPSAGFSFIALPNADPPRKRPRRKYEEIDRIYHCNWESCKKAYGTLNHLNQHIQVHKHGPKRTPMEFKDVRKLQRSMSRTPSNPEFRGTSSQPAASQGGVVPDRPNFRHPAGSDMDTFRPSHRDLPSIEIPSPFNPTLGSQSANEPSHHSQQSLAPPGGPSSAPLGPRSQYGAHGQALSRHVPGQEQLYERNQVIPPNIDLGDAGYLSRPVALHHQLNYQQVDRRPTSQEAHGYRNELHSRVPPAQNPVPISYQVSAQELWAQQQQQPQQEQQQQPRALFHPHRHQVAYSAQPPVDHYPVTGIYNDPPHPTQGHAYYAAGDAVRYEHPSQRPTQLRDVEPLDLSYTSLQASAGPSRPAHLPQDHQFPMDNQHVSWSQPRPTRPTQGPGLPLPSNATFPSKMGPLDPSSTLLTSFRQKDPPPP